MTGFRLIRVALLALGVLLAVGVAAAFAGNLGGARVSAGSNDDWGGHVAMEDDCDPDDPGWAAVGGCALARGDVTFAEFLGENDSPLAASVVGHQAWRNDPSYLEVKAGKSIRIKNEGGRPHTFTKVAAFGGGKIGPPGVGLNEGLATATECPASIDIAPGDSTRVSGLAQGNHRFQCCIHPWMRALIKVHPRGARGD